MQDFSENLSKVSQKSYENGKNESKLDAQLEGQNTDKQHVDLEEIKSKIAENLFKCIE